MAFGNLGFPNKHGRGNSVFWQGGGGQPGIGLGLGRAVPVLLIVLLAVGISWERSLGFLRGSRLGGEYPWKLLWKGNIRGRDGNFRRRKGGLGY